MGSSAAGAECVFGLWREVMVMYTRLRAGGLFLGVYTIARLRDRLLERLISYIALSTSCLLFLLRCLREAYQHGSTQVFGQMDTEVEYCYLERLLVLTPSSTSGLLSTTINVHKTLARSYTKERGAMDLG